VDDKQSLRAIQSIIKTFPFVKELWPIQNKCPTLYDLARISMRAPILSILLIGPQTSNNSLGGCTVSFDGLVKCLSAEATVNLRVIDSNLSKLTGLFRRTLGALALVARIITYLPRCDVAGLHTTHASLPLSSAVLLCLCRFFRRPLIVRKFGGLNHKESLARDGKIRESHKRLICWVLKKVDVYLVESLAALKKAEEDGIECAAWFPNSRPMPKAKCEQELLTDCTRFVFLGHVKKWKGIYVLMDAARHLPQGISIDIYGPSFENIDKGSFQECASINYQRVLRPENVISVLKQYDAMVMPTLYQSEGYPGSILEGYVAELPVIASEIGRIPEIVDETCGILVGPGDAHELSRAMMKLATNKELYCRLKNGVLRKRRELDSAYWAEMYLQHCRRLAEVKHELDDKKMLP